MLLFVTVEAAVHNLTLMPISTSEVMATWNINLDLFELYNFIVAYFIKLEQQETQIVIGNSYQISNLIPGETYTVRVTAYYSETTGSRVFPAVSTEGTVTLDKIGSNIIGLLYLKLQTNLNT